MSEIKPFRLLTYNIHKGFAFHGLKYHLQDIKDAIIKLKADFVCLQEVRGHHIFDRKSLQTHNQLEVIADTIWPHAAYGKNAVYTETHHGNGVLSRYPIQSWENIDVSTNRMEKRGILHVTICPPDWDVPLHLMCLHLNLLEVGRVKQVKVLSKRINEHVDSTHPLIIAGDFNDWRGRLDNLITEEVGVAAAHLDANRQLIKTFPSFFPLLPLDKIYYRNLELIECGLPKDNHWSVLSDHLPLFADFAVME